MTLKVILFSVADFYSFMVNLMKGFDDGVKAWIGPFLFFIPQKPEDIQIILNSVDCQNKPLFLYRELFSYGLIAMNGEEYKVHRKAFSPLFTPKALRSFVPMLDDIMNKFLVDFDSNLKPEAFDMLYDSMDYTFNANLVTFLGVNMDKKERSTFLDRSRE